MSATENPPGDHARDKLDEDDHDLLTFGEAGERLRLEIAAAREDVARLEGTDQTADLAKARARLGASRGVV